jgi:hypothetical protein
MGSRNHHLKSVSTPQQLFAQQVFCGLQPFFSASPTLYKPYKQRITKLSSPSQPKEAKQLVGLASK